MGPAQQAVDRLKNAVEHRFGESAGESILLTGVITANQPPVVT